jgi:hypothetical protein
MQLSYGSTRRNSKWCGVNSTTAVVLGQWLVLSGDYWNSNTSVCLPLGTDFGTSLLRFSGLARGSSRPFLTKSTNPLTRSEANPRSDRS